MTPAARVQSAIELLDEMLAAAREGGAAADTVATRFFKARRYAGAGDRRAIRDLAWAALRRFGEPPPSGRAAMVALADDDTELAALFSGEGHGPVPIRADEPRAGGGPIPAWLIPRLAALLRDSAAEQAALLDRAPLDLRIAASADLEAARAELPQAEPLPGLPRALRLPHGAIGPDHPLLASGLAEVQDAGSQWVALAAAVREGGVLLDLAAGAGGKTLAVADQQRAARIVASDVDRGRLSRIAPRAARAGLTGIETRLLDPGREAQQLADLADGCDLVLVDAPCSGSGTWRRNPETRWRLTPARLERLVATQARLLELAAPLVRPGGALVYAVCSLLEEEGAGQAADFLARHPGWRADALPFGRAAGPGRLLSPAHDGSDGFFVARLSR